LVLKGNIGLPLFSVIKRVYIFLLDTFREVGKVEFLEFGFLSGFFGTVGDFLYFQDRLFGLNRVLGLKSLGDQGSFSPFDRDYLDIIRTAGVVFVPKRNNVAFVEGVVFEQQPDVGVGRFDIEHFEVAGGIFLFYDFHKT